MDATVRCEFCGERNALTAGHATCARCGRALPSAASTGDQALTNALCEALWTVARGDEPDREEVTQLVVRGLIARASRPEGYELTSLGLDALREAPGDQ